MVVIARILFDMMSGVAVFQYSGKPNSGYNWVTADLLILTEKYDGSGDATPTVSTLVLIQCFNATFFAQAESIGKE